MAKFDEQLSRMSYLMSYTSPINENKESNNLEYSTVGADGKAYGILKEGNKYYIKTAEGNKKNIAEAYDYINGFNYRRENEYSSYNSATKALELKLMSLNEAYGKHEDVSTVDFNRSSKVLASLTEEARKELNRVHQIMENIGIQTNIGNHGNPESKGSSTGANTTKNNEPFSQKASASLDKDSVASESNPAKANDDYKDASKGIDADLQSDKMKGHGDKSLKDYTAAHDDLDGESVADKTPSGGKVVRVNEGMFEEFDDDLDVDYEDAEDLDDATGSFGEMEDADEFGMGDDIYSSDDFPEPIDANPNEYFDNDNNNDSIVGLDDETDSFGEEGDSDEEFGMVDECGDFDMLNEDDLITGDNEVLVGKGGTEEVMTWDKMDGGKGKRLNPQISALDGPKGSGNNLDWDKMNESRNRKFNMIVENVTRNVIAKINGRKPMKESIQDKINRIIKEEMIDLGYGKHPRYGQEPFTTPNNPEGDGRLVGTATKDWNHSSAKGSQRYGKRIGDGAPFSKSVGAIENSVINEVMRRLKKK